MYEKFILSQNKFKKIVITIYSPNGRQNCGIDTLYKRENDRECIRDLVYICRYALALLEFCSAMTAFWSAITMFI